MVISISALAEPIGSIKSWLRPNASTELPGGWLICDGSTVVDVSSPFNGLTIPDLRAKFPRGHATLTNLNFASDSVYFAGGLGTIPAGGADSVDLTHGHTIPDHGHVVPSEPNHDHGALTGLKTIGAPFTDGGGLAITINTDPHDHSIAVDGAHDHGGATQDTALAADNALSATENRPAYDELLLIIKVR